jgi:hypothetical protein
MLVTMKSFIFSDVMPCSLAAFPSSELKISYASNKQETRNKKLKSAPCLFSISLTLEVEAVHSSET